MSERGGGPPVNLDLRVRGLEPSATVAINERSNALRAAGRSVRKLGLGQSPFPVPPRVVDALRAHAHEKDYLPVTGLRALQQGVVEHAQRTIGIERGAEDVIIGPGSKELMFLLQLAHYSELVVPNPSWVSYAPQSRILGRRVRFVPTTRADQWMLSAETFDRVCSEDPGRPRLLILNYPSNPTGATLKESQLESLAQVARKHGVILLSDEIYGELHHEGAHASIARFYPEGTIVSSGLSKWCGAGGWRLGTFVFPPELRWLREAMTAAASETYTSTSAPIQYAAITAFDGGEDLVSYLESSRRVLRSLGAFAHARFSAAKIDCPRPEGGFYLFLDFESRRESLRARGIQTSVQLCEQLLEDLGVAILPGSHFGRPDGELTARAAYVDFDGTAALAAADDVESGALDDTWLRAHCASVTTAIDDICDWA